MNVLFITTIYPDKQNPAMGVFIREQALILKKYHNVTVLHLNVNYRKFSIFPNYKTVERKTTQNLDEIKIEIKSSLPFYNKIIIFSSILLFIKKSILRGNKIDLLHCHIAYPSGVAGWLVKKIHNIPYIITEHSDVELQFRSPLHKFLILKSYKNCELIIPVSEHLGSLISKYTKTKIRVIHNFIHPERFDSTTTINNNGIAQIGFIANLSGFNKGLDLLIEILSQIRDRDYFLHIGGGGSNIEDFKSLAKKAGIFEKCKFYGWLSPDEIPGFLAGIDFYVLASHHETFGIVLIEAMASGKPVISTKCGGPEEIVTYETGLLVENHNPEALKKAIIQMIDHYKNYDPGLLKKYVADHFSEKKFEHEITDVYNLFDDQNPTNDKFL